MGDVKQKHSDADQHGCQGEGCPVVKPESAVVALDETAIAEVQTVLNVQGMDCADEVAALERVLRPLPGIKEFKVNLMGGAVTIHHDATVSPKQLIKAVESAGLKAHVRSGEPPEEASSTGQRNRLISVVVAGLFTGIGLLLQWADYGDPWWKNLVFAVAIVAGGWFILPKAIRAARRLALDMNVLMTVAVAGAIAIGEWSEAAAVTFLFAFSELLEAYSLNRARRAVKSLLELAPETALRKEGEIFKEVSVERVAVGDILSIRSGSKIPLDGIVISGESSINQAPITGESVPVDKKPDDQVFAGTINGEGSLEIKATKLYSDSTLSRIIHLVEEAQSQKAPSQQFVDRFARIYTPAVFLVALGVLLVPPLLFNGPWDAWIYRSLVLLVIACPCALVISTPVSIVSGLTAMARRGVLIKGGAFLEEVGKLKALAVDKTGTITEGKPKVYEIIPWKGKPADEILAVAAGIDIHSEHPLARAIVMEAETRNVSFKRSINYQAKTGRGAEAEIDGRIYFVGNHRFAHESAVCSDELEQKLKEIEAKANSVVIVGRKAVASDQGEVIGIIAVGDTIRANAVQAIKALHDAGVVKVVMLSGDNQRTVDAIAKKVGIDEAKGDLLPEHKIDRVRELLAEHRHVGMVGDGVNDAPAMAIASIGFAMGGAGTDTAIETADIALMQDDLSKVAEVIILGKQTLGIIRANIAFSIAVKAVFLILAFLGITSLWLAILADTGATLLVIANALRLLKHKQITPRT